MDDLEITPPTKRSDDSLALRWAIRGLFVLCMALISTVLMSEPRIASQIKVLTEELSDRLRVSDVTEEPTTPEETVRPAVKRLPDSTVPVRRVGQ